MRAIAVGTLLGSAGLLSLPLPALPAPASWAGPFDATIGIALRIAGTLLLAMIIVGRGRAVRAARVASHPSPRTALGLRLDENPGSSKRSGVPGIVPGLLPGIVAGALLAAGSVVDGVRTRLPVEQSGIELRLSGRVASLPERDEGRVAFDFAIEGIEGLDALASAPELARVRLTRYGETPAYRAGERWSVTVRLKPPLGLANDGGFDRERHSFVRRIDARGTIRSTPAPLRLDRARPARAGGVAALRERLRARLASVAGPEPRLAVIEALTLGVTDGLDEATRDRLRATGTSHLLAISGLHVGLVAGGGFAFARGAARWRRRVIARRRRLAERRGLDPPEEHADFPAESPASPSWRSLATFGGAGPAILALSLASCYAVAAGFGLPTQRALLGISVVALAALRQRHLAPGTALCAALVAVLAFDPLAPLGAGFWLSFGSVALIAWLHGGRARTRRRWLGLLRTHALLGVAMLPLGAWFFQQGSLAAPVANLVAVPLVGFVIVPLALGALVLAFPWPGAAAVLLALAARAIDALMLFLELLGEPDTIAPALVLPTLALLGATFAALALCSFPARGRSFLVLVPVLLLPSALHNARGPATMGFELHVLDVGQGLAALVLTPEHALLFDTGGRFGDSDMFEVAVLPHLLANGRRKIDVLVVSHGDEDHSAGLATAVARFPAMRVYASDVAAASAALRADGAARTDDALRADGVASTDVAACLAGEGFELDDVRFSFLHPAAHDRGSDNDRSCVLLVHRGGSRVLLTGDIETASERRLAERLTAVVGEAAGGRGEVASLPVDVIVAPHHGSDTSSSEAFLEAFPSRSVVFPAGFGNAWGFPDDSVQSRYESHHVRQHVTGLEGALVFRFDGSESAFSARSLRSLGVGRSTDDARRGEPEGWRRRHRRPWRADTTMPGLAGPDL